jgi:hypothetical protein
VVIGRQGVLATRALWRRFVGAAGSAQLEDLVSDGTALLACGLNQAGQANFRKDIRRGATSWEFLGGLDPKQLSRGAVNAAGRVVFIGDINGASGYVAYTDTHGDAYVKILGVGDNLRPLLGLAYNGVVWCTTHFTGVLPGDFLTSPDGVAWTRRTPAVIMGNGLYFGLAVGLNGRFWMVGGFGAAGFSDDNGVNWTDKPPGAPIADLYAVAYNGSVVAACGQAVLGGGRAHLVSALNHGADPWVNRFADVPRELPLFEMLVLPRSRRFLAVGAAKPDGTPYALLGSADGLTWTQFALPFAGVIRGGTPIGGRIYFVGHQAARALIMWTDGLL